MNKILRYSLLAAVAFVCNVTFAQTVFDFDANGQTMFGLPGESCSKTQTQEASDAGNFTEDATATVGNITATVTATTDEKATPNRLWNASPKLRLYNGTLTVASSSKKITCIVFDLASQASKCNWGANTVNAGELSTFTKGVSTNVTWTGSTNSLVLSVAANSQISKMTVYVEGETTPDTPEEPTDGAIFSETFAAGQGAFTIDNVSLGEGLSYVWKHDASNQYMKASAYNKKNIAAESWLVSPEIDLTKATDATLTFSQCINKYFGTVANEATLWVKANGGEWQQLTITYPEIQSGKNWSKMEEQTVDLASVLGKKIQFAFKYVSTASAAGTWELKNVKVEGTISTSINTVATQSNVNAPMFNLAGQRVSKDYKGVVIKNGKKFINK